MEGSSMEESELMFLEAGIAAGPTGKEWEVTIIGAQRPDDLLTIEGRQFIVSDNGRLYDTAAIAKSVAMWDGVKVYDNHLTDEEFARKQGMRSPATEWLGTIVKPRWDAKRAQLRGVFKVVEEKLAAKLKAAHDSGVLSTIGLSIDTFPIVGADIFHEGQRLPVIEGFNAIRSVDLVADPAAGGKIERLIASNVQGDRNMSEETQDGLTKEAVAEMISAALADALAAQEADDVEEMTDQEVIDAVEDKELSETKKKRLEEEKRAAEARREADLARTDLRLTAALSKAKLPDKFAAVVEAQFKGRVANQDEIDQAVKYAREAWASTDPTGRINSGGISDISVGMDDSDKFAMAYMRTVMGEEVLRSLEHHEDREVQKRLKENDAYQSWLKAGKPAMTRYPKISTLLYEYLKGDPVLDGRVLEAATTSTLATVVKNTVNIMAANSYSQREMWWEPIVTTHEVDTIDDATLARVYGTDNLPTVAEGAAYTELPLEDEEETASFVKRGGYIGITLETLMRDKIGYVQRIPQGLADAWYNTQSDLVANVFTINTAAGPVLGTTGALFNATALTSAGGHANLLTTGLSYSEFGVVRTAMQKQTDQTLGTGRRLAGSNVPRWLLVPVDLEQTALEIRNSELQPGADFDAAGGGAQTKNLWMNSFEVIVVPPWTDVNNWAAVSALPAIHLIYPRGQRAPQIFTADAETAGTMFTNDELRFKARLMTYRFSATYDCAPVSDFRPLHKSNV
jgi:hypothetical protein